MDDLETEALLDHIMSLGQQKDRKTGVDVGIQVFSNLKEGKTEEEW